MGSASAAEIVETTDGRRLRLGDDGRYEWLAPTLQDAQAASTDAPEAAPTLANFLAAPSGFLGQRIALDVTLRLLGGRALASDAGAPGLGLAVDLDKLPEEDRARVVRDCGMEGCRVRLAGLARRNANGPFLDAETLEALP